MGVVRGLARLITVCTPMICRTQVHDEVILEGPKESADVAQALVVDCMMRPFDGVNPLDVELVVDAKHADTWFAAK
jgi:DNA polymerase I